MLTGCMKQQEITLSYSFTPNETHTYNFALLSKILTITHEIDFKLIAATNDTLKIEAEIQAMRWKGDGGELEKETNEYYKNNYINIPFEFAIDTQGDILENLSYKNSGREEAIFDINSFFIALPKGNLKIGDSWTIERPVEDMVFDKVKTRYTLKKVTENSVAIIEVFSDFKEDNSKRSTVAFSKNLQGDYVLNTKTGLLESAQLTISGFNGFSNISGTLSIHKK
ncbi:hypothetical protein C8N46_11231 [Kordia periserrulae]|uniref:Lipoprotein n=2 Tax=Kordia periserrulae TaxID=701523 RepID=A0A2T6BRL6_9FLAO|nr:hypothetical protein C8N46_11231 [Kordia periserrulae]